MARQRRARRVPLLRLVAQAVLLAVVAGGPEDADSERKALAAEAGANGAHLLQLGQGEQAARAFRLAARLQPSLWQAHYSLGASLLTMCRCRGAMSAYAQALAALRQQGGSALHEAAVLKAQATSALPIAKVAADSTRQQRMLGFVASSLERAFALSPEPQSPLYHALLRARGTGGLHHLLLLSSGGECVSLLQAQAADAASQGQLSHAVSLYNRARQLDPDSQENFRLLREAIQAEEADNARRHTPRRAYAPGIPPDALLSFSQNGQDRWIFEQLVEPLLLRSPRALAGVFVEAGAVDGVTNSNTLFFERYLGWSGLLVEPGVCLRASTCHPRASR